MAILFRDQKGATKTLSKREFHRTFGAEYAPSLILPRVIPKDFLGQCAEYGATPIEGVGPRRLKNYRRQLAKGHLAPTYIARISDEVGYGLYAARDLRSGEMIGEYAGSLSRDWTPSTKKDGDMNPYLFIFPFKTAYGIDAKKKGNALRFVNHSSENNNARHLYVSHDGVVRVIFVVVKRIPKHSQILINYGKYYKRVYPVELEPRFLKS